MVSKYGNHSEGFTAFVADQVRGAVSYLLIVSSTSCPLCNSLRCLTPSCAALLPFIAVFGCQRHLVTAPRSLPPLVLHKPALLPSPNT